MKIHFENTFHRTDTWTRTDARMRIDARRVRNIRQRLCITGCQCCHNSIGATRITDSDGALLECEDRADGGMSFYYYADTEGE
jgi:hypothetical protein